jgi:hypothetical protein
MADTRETRYDSWKEYYQKKGEEETGLVRHLQRAKISYLDEFPSQYANDPGAFKEKVALFPYGNFILLPAGTNQVRCLHSCFIFGDLGEPTQVIGILGSRRSSPFKSLNIDQAVKQFTEPRNTRNSDSSRGDTWIPSMEEFMECENVEEFKSLVSEEDDYPMTGLWLRAQTLWVHPKIFELIDANASQSAGVLAMNIIRALPFRYPTGEEDEDSVDEAHCLVAFLWAVENLRATKVSLNDAPTSELFDNRAQEVIGHLDPETRSQSRAASVRHDLEEEDSSSSGQSKSRRRKKRKGKRERNKGRGTRQKGGSRHGRNRNRKGYPSSDDSKSTTRSPSPSSSGPSSSPSPSSSSNSSSTSVSKSPHRRSSTSPDPRARRSKTRSPRSRSASRPRTRSRSRSRSRSWSRSRSRSRSRPRRGRHPNRGEDDHLNAAMMRNLTAITASHLRRDVRADQKKSMLSRLAPEAAKLFDMLSARDWEESAPKMNAFVKDLISDKDSQRASGIMATTTKKWSGEISDKGLLSFFANGFAATDIQESPGGFTIFMFRPITAHVPSNRKDRRQQVKSMFGNTELDEEAVKYYAESDFFLPETLADLEEQIYTCIKTLELFTEREGIAVEGFLHGMKMIQKDRRLFKNFLSVDPLFAVKFAYLLDRVFQNFVDKLGDFYQERRPIRKARRRLENSQREAIERAMTGYEVSAIPQLFLPSSLRGENPERHQHHQDSDGGSKQKKKLTQDKADATPAWWAKNPNTVQSWRLPSGKTFTDFFDTTVPERRANTTDWPKLPHHKNPSRVKSLCLKYQSKGTCSALCYMSHMDPAKMNTTLKKTIDDRFKLVYST